MPSTFYLPNLLVVVVLTLLLVSVVWATITAALPKAQLIAVLSILACGLASKFIVVNTIGVGLNDIFHRTDLFMLLAFAIATLIIATSLFDRISASPKVTPGVDTAQQQTAHY